jgi:hypothetical protein
MPKGLSRGGGKRLCVGCKAKDLPECTSHQQPVPAHPVIARYVAPMAQTWRLVVLCMCKNTLSLVIMAMQRPHKLHTYTHGNTL